MLAQYLPILIFLSLSTIIGIVLVFLGGLLGPTRPDSEKLSPYECGFEAFEDSRTKFDVRYYLVAILFIIFDLEITFFCPGRWPWTCWGCSALPRCSYSSLNWSSATS